MKTNMLRNLGWLLIAGLLCACGAGTPAATVLPTSTPASTSTPQPATPACAGQGSIGNDHVPNPSQGFSIYFQYYLPPCYADQPGKSFPTLYLLTLSSEKSLSPTDNTPLSLADRLIRAGKLPPAIVVVPDAIVGYGSDAALTTDLVPYVDGKFRTLRDPRQRGVGGISHGAAIAARMAFQFPQVFGSVGLLSGGIADNEGPRFEEWIRRTPADRLPRVHIDVGDQDAILRLTNNLLRVLDANHVPYTLNIGHGNHNWTFWSPLMEPYLVWFAQVWEEEGREVSSKQVAGRQVHVDR